MTIGWIRAKGSGRGGGGGRGAGVTTGVSDKENEDSESSSSQCFPRPQEDLPPLLLPLEDLPPLLPLPADFPPGGSAGSAGRYEPEAVAPELAPDPAFLGGELGSVDAAAPEEPRALFSFCRCFLLSAFA